MNVVEAEGLTVRYGSVEAVSNVSFSIAAGETLALVGANGAGKTSTINALLGILPGVEGSVSVFGADPRSDRAALARRWGVMPQSGGLPMGLKAGECVDLFADLYGRTADAAQAAIQDCGLAAIADRRWRSLSGGEQQRLSLAVALVGGEDLLVLDEPTAALDVPGQDRVLQIIRERADSGSAVLLTTHRFDEVERVADRVAILHGGRLIADSSVAELTQAVPEIRLGGVTLAQVSSIDENLGTSFRAVGSGSIATRIDPDDDASEVLRDVLGWCAQNGVPTTSASVGSRSLADAYREMVDE